MERRHKSVDTENSMLNATLELAFSPRSPPEEWHCRDSGFPSGLPDPTSHSVTSSALVLRGKTIIAKHKNGVEPVRGGPKEGKKLKYWVMPLEEKDSKFNSEMIQILESLISRTELKEKTWLIFPLFFFFFFF